MNEASPIGLMIPVDVAALCVGEVDAQQATSGFAGATTDYSPLDDHGAFLGSNINRSIDGPPLRPLPQGVHLHWAVPDALTRGVQGQDSLSFPTLPNRWLLTRLLAGNKTMASQSWIIESDTLQTTPVDSQQPVTLPVDDPEQNFRYLGRWQQFDGQWQSPAATLKKLTGTALTATSSGVVSFAAYYPDSASVFGFHDPLTDLTPSGNTPLQLMYTVTGWFDDPSDDPLNSQPTLAEIQEQYHWTFTAAPGVNPGYCLFHGLTQNIPWNPETVYLYRQPCQADIVARVAVGNTPAEALSAYFTALDEPGLPLFEAMLTALQSGQLQTFMQPLPNRLAQLYQNLQEQRFATVAAGTLYTIELLDPEDPEEEGPEVTDLPLQLADDLNQLNLLQQQYDQCQTRLNDYRWQLFADWYRIFLANDDTQNLAYQVAYHRYGNYPPLVEECQQKLAALQAQTQVVNGQLGQGFLLKPLPAPRYYQGTEPVVLLAGDEALRYPSRYGGDGDDDPQGYLICRTTDQILGGLAIQSTTVSAATFGTMLATPNHLPHAEPCNALVQEAALLNLSWQSQVTGLATTTLAPALTALLTGQQQNIYTPTGLPPAPLAISLWRGTPWLPLFLYWEVDFLPVQPTVQGNTLLNYPPDFFTSNFTIDQESGGTISCQGFDPTTAAFSQTYRGDSLLQPGVAAHFADLLSRISPSASDAVLEKILQQLQTTSILVQPLSGFANALLMRQQDVQLNVTVPAGSPYNQLTQAMASAIGDQNNPGPAFDNWFNPIRAGYAKFSLKVVDAFGQRRTVQISQLDCAQTMVARDSKQQPIPDMAYLEPRLAQPGRLLFRWLAADSTGHEEMNSHPATSPICGWLLPNHLDGGFFLYNPQGQPLGELYLNGDKSKIFWQSAPGNRQTINQDLATVMAGQNPVLARLALALLNGSSQFFMDFWQAVDTQHGDISPGATGQDNHLAVLIGRPVALVQTMLRLEMAGSPAIDQGWASFAGNQYNETDHHFTGVGFPILLGDRSRLDDGLVGFFKSAPQSGAYDLSTFYSAGADPSWQSGVVQPAVDTVLLTPTPHYPATSDDGSHKILLLVDPRASVYATPAILPVKSLTLPADLVNQALGVLEMSFPILPVLVGSSAMTLPMPLEDGYCFSWIEESRESGDLSWTVNGEITPPADQGLWSYTPQHLSEGWLRMNPLVLTFTLLNATGLPVVSRGVSQPMTLTLTNRKPANIVFTPGKVVAEGSDPGGSILYIHLDGLVDIEDLPGLQWRADGWQFQFLSPAPNVGYWAGVVTKPLTLEASGTLQVTLSGFKVAATASAKSDVLLDYYQISGLNDGVDAAQMSVIDPA